MKASEYFEKYKGMISTNIEEVDNFPVSDLFMEFSAETREILKKRGVKKDRATLAVIKEQNDKWNGLCNRFENHFGFSPIRRDGFKRYWSDKLGVAI